jgi:DNA-binding transcriptional regulator GbsR (MarR family)
MGDRSQRGGVLDAPRTHCPSTPSGRSWAFTQRGDPAFDYSAAVSETSTLPSISMTRLPRDLRQEQRGRRQFRQEPDCQRCYIQNILNNQNAGLSPEQRRFIDDMGNFINGQGLGHSVGRVWGYLLLCAEPARLEDIGIALGISKSGASTAARMLDTWGLARRLPGRGSRRIHYEPIASPQPLLASGAVQLQTFLRTLDEGKRVATSDLSASRLEHLSSGFRLYLDAIEQALQRSKEMARS